MTKLNSLDKDLVRKDVELVLNELSEKVLVNEFS